VLEEVFEQVMAFAAGSSRPILDNAVIE